MDYKYKDLEEDGYVRFTISRKEHNKILKNRQTAWHSTYEYYIKDDHIIIQNILNVYGCIVQTLLFPIGIVLEGFMNIKEVYTNMIVRTWGAKKYGAFSSDAIYRHKEDSTYEKLVGCGWTRS